MVMTTVSSPSRPDRDAPRDQAGVAGAIASTCRQTGAAVGVAVTGCGVMVMLRGMVSTGRWALATAERNGARLATDMSPAPEGAR